MSHAVVSRRLDVDGADHLLAQHLSAALVRFGSAALGIIDLPSIEQATPSKPELQAAAVLAWAREVESTGLLEVVDAIASGVSSGALPLELDPAAARRLIEHHRERQERFGHDERIALYGRLMADVDADLATLVGALADLGRMPANASTIQYETRAAVAGGSLASTLSARASGIAAYAARDITTQIREALDLLGTPSIAQALGGGGVWSIVQRYADLAGAHPAIGRAAARAGAIRTIISWLADHAQALASGRVAVSRTDPVVAAALTWSAEG
jgi:hypothetical protein